MHNNILAVTLDNVITWVYVLIIVAIILVIINLFWTAVWIPIKKLEILEETKEKEQKELDKILAAKGSEWDNYQRLMDEVGRLRSEQISLANKNSELENKNAQLTVTNSELFAVNKELKKVKAADVKTD